MGDVYMFMCVLQVQRVVHRLPSGLQHIQRQTDSQQLCSRLPGQGLRCPHFTVSWAEVVILCMPERIQYDDDAALMGPPMSSYSLDAVFTFL